MAAIVRNPPINKAGALLVRYAELADAKAQATDAYKQAVAPLDAEMQELKTELEVWSEKNRAAFGDKKSLKLDAGTFGYKLGLAAVTFPLDAPDDIKDKYLKVVAQELPTAIVESVDSRKVVGAWLHFPNLVKKLGKLGITVSQTDSFYITPKK